MDTELRLEVKSTVRDIDAAEWNLLVGEGSVFLEWEWLASLEESGCVGPRTGWAPQHLLLSDGKRLIGACPLYVKAHSMGEFVFDHGWAEAAEAAGIRYYPKLLAGVPFTPATGARFLTHPEADRAAAIRALGGALKEICRKSGFSSVHVNFCLPDEVETLAAIGFERRTGYQFQWMNPEWRTFADYLAALRSKRRTQVKRERRALDDQGITIRALAGEEIPDDLFPVMFELYKSTVDKLYWGRRYLNEELFELCRLRWKTRLCFVIAERGTRVVAGTFNVRKGDVLYGRYWGCFEEIPFLHFNVCYYAAIEYCLREGIRRFEPGAGGEFKHLRGFEAQPTDSMHFLADPRLAHAVRDYLARERRAVDRHIGFMEERSALRR